MDGENHRHKRFDRDFKLSAVKMCTEGGHTTSEVARIMKIDNLVAVHRRRFRVTTKARLSLKSVSLHLYKQSTKQGKYKQFFNQSHGRLFRSVRKKEK